MTALNEKPASFAPKNKFLYIITSGDRGCMVRFHVVRAGEGWSENDGEEEARLVLESDDLAGSEPELVTVATFRDLPEALLAKAQIESSGIKCWMADDNLVRTNWLWSSAVGGVRLQVRREEANAAEEILNQPVPENLTDSQSGERYDQPQCPKCLSREVSYSTLNRPLTYGLWLLLSITLPIPRNQWHCDSCGFTWKDEPR